MPRSFFADGKADQHRIIVEGRRSKPSTTAEVSQRKRFLFQRRKLNMICRASRKSRITVYRQVKVSSNDGRAHMRSVHPEEFVIE